MRKAVAVVAVIMFCGCARPYSGEPYPLRAATSSVDGHENLLRYPDNWPEVSQRRERGLEARAE